MTTKSELLFREVKPEGKIPKGKKLMIIAGVVLVDESVPDDVMLTVDIQNTDVGIVISEIKSAPASVKQHGWEIGEILKEGTWSAGKPYSTRHVDFTTAADRALKIISHRAATTLDELDELDKQIRKDMKHLPIFDSMRTVMESILSSLVNRKTELKGTK